MTQRTGEDLNCRARAILRAVATGRVEITCSSEPDLFVDGLPCCDQYTAHLLAHRGLVVQAGPGRLGQRLRARLTPAGAAALSTVAEAA
ncbi:hypothetical protein GCM10027258_48140 [Amycolatopsis stemonae]